MVACQGCTGVSFGPGGDCVHYVPCIRRDLAAGVRSPAVGVRKSRPGWTNRFEGHDRTCLHANSDVFVSSFELANHTVRFICLADLRQDRLLFRSVNSPADQKKFPLLGEGSSAGQRTHGTRVCLVSLFWNFEKESFHSSINYETNLMSLINPSLAYNYCSFTMTI